MRTKPDDEFGPGRAPTSSAIRTLLGDLTGEELERLATAVIREHRVRLQKAQDLFEEIGRLEASSGPTQGLEPVADAYRIAMLDLHAQHHIVSLVVAKLGYVPVVDGLRPVLN